ncbi:DUF393 domain-containing protein [Chitinivorax sp. B]|uniref:thiol-disulfide oxidoreductase DCC family protein n=1 Tax=Chitinivorax sp. B TaxID=2502235 RepID=UPI0010F9E61A|nr:DUF393 domain-containing protein [Chitinivorax sp. B]
MPALTLLYDSNCNLCRTEMTRICKWDRHNAVRLVDIHAPHFNATQFGTTQAALLARVHGVAPDGQLLIGMQTVRAAYCAVGMGWLLNWTGYWPVRPLIDGLYDWIARNRYRLSSILRYHCDSDQCRI